MATSPCEIIFNNPYKTYFAGETVTGRVEVIFNKPKIITGIYLHIRGETQINWSRGSNNNPRYITKEYFNIESFLVGGIERDEFTLPPGRHIYPFSYVLQPTLPTSVEGIRGHTRYTVKANVERLWRWSHIVKSEFSVIAPCNLNEFSSLKLPVTVSANKYFCCFCCKSGPLACIVKIPKTGFVCGESITVFTELDNVSKVKIPNVYLEFVQLVKYFKTPFLSDHKTEKKFIEKKTLGSLMARDSKTWSYDFIVPPLPPTTVHLGSMIQLHYELVIEVAANILHEEIKLIIPITIGTTPITDDPSMLPKLTASTSVDSQASNTSGSSGLTLIFAEDQTSSAETIDYKLYYPVYHFEDS